MKTELDFSLPNVGSGPDTLSLADLSAEVNGVVVLLQRDYHCGNCRSQVQAVADRYGEFQDRNVEVISVVPEPPDRVRDWQDSYNLPFPLLADPDKTVGEAYDQPVRFGCLGDLSDLLGRMPKAILLDTREGFPRVVYSHEGSSTWDRPETDDLLAAIDQHLA